METKSLQGRYHLSGDTAEYNSNGTISFIGRDDDVLTSAGYRIGQFNRMSD
jgi:acetyl-CoA synthetase